MSRAPTLLQRFSHVYKTSRFPWKKHVLIGHDLSGNEYWEAPNPHRAEGRPKRWVQMKEQQQYSDFEQEQLPVQWQAWLRHTRPTSPTIREIIEAEKKRQLIMARAKQLDEDWEQRKLQLQEEDALLLEENKQRRTADGQFVPGSWTPTARER